LTFFSRHILSKYASYALAYARMSPSRIAESFSGSSTLRSRVTSGVGFVRIT